MKRSIIFSLTLSVLGFGLIFGTAQAAEASFLSGVYGRVVTGAENVYSGLTSGVVSLVKSAGYLIGNRSGVAQPTATITIDGGSNKVYKIGEIGTYAWTSSNADTFDFSMTSNDPTNCGETDWQGSEANGSLENTFGTIDAGCVWDIVFVASNSGNNLSASDHVRVTVNTVDGQTPVKPAFKYGPSTSPLPYTTNAANYTNQSSGGGGVFNRSGTNYYLQGSRVINTPITSTPTPGSGGATFQTPTPTPSPSTTNRPTPTPALTPTPTPSTSSGQATPTPALTPTPTPTHAPTPTPTPALTPTPTPSTGSGQATPSPTPTPSPTYLPTPTPTPTSTNTPTPTPTLSPTPTPTPTNLPTPTPSSSPVGMTGEDLVANVLGTLNIVGRVLDGFWGR